MIDTRFLVGKSAQAGSGRLLPAAMGHRISVGHVDHRRSDFSTIALIAAVPRLARLSIDIMDAYNSLSIMKISTGSL